MPGNMQQGQGWESLRVKVIRAEALECGAHFVVLRIGDQVAHTEVLRTPTTEPVWDQTLTFSGVSSVSPLLIEVQDASNKSPPGKFCLSLENLASNHTTHRQVRLVEQAGPGKWVKPSNRQPKLLLELVACSPTTKSEPLAITTSEGGLKVRVVEARGVSAFFDWSVRLRLQSHGIIHSKETSIKPCSVQHTCTWQEDVSFEKVVDVNSVLVVELTSHTTNQENRDSTETESVVSITTSTNSLTDSNMDHISGRYTLALAGLIQDTATQLELGLLQRDGSGRWTPSSKGWPSSPQHHAKRSSAINLDSPTLRVVVTLLGVGIDIQAAEPPPPAYPLIPGVNDKDIAVVSSTDIERVHQANYGEPVATLLVKVQEAIELAEPPQGSGGQRPFIQLVLEGNVPQNTSYGNGFSNPVWGAEGFTFLLFNPKHELRLTALSSGHNNEYIILGQYSLSLERLLLQTSNVATCLDLPLLIRGTDVSTGKKKWKRPETCSHVLRLVVEVRKNADSNSNETDVLTVKSKNADVRATNNTHINTVSTIVAPAQKRHVVPCMSTPKTAVKARHRSSVPTVEKKVKCALRRHTIPRVVPAVRNTISSQTRVHPRRREHVPCVVKHRVSVPQVQHKKPVIAVHRKSVPVVDPTKKKYSKPSIEIQAVQVSDVSMLTNSSSRCSIVFVAQITSKDNICLSNILQSETPVTSKTVNFQNVGQVLPNSTLYNQAPRGVNIHQIREEWENSTLNINFRVTSPSDDNRNGSETATTKICEIPVNHLLCNETVEKSLTVTESLNIKCNVNFAFQLRGIQCGRDLKGESFTAEDAALLAQIEKELEEEYGYDNEDDNLASLNSTTVSNFNSTHSTWKVQKQLEQLRNVEHEETTVRKDIVDAEQDEWGPLWRKHLIDITTVKRTIQSRDEQQKEKQEGEAQRLDDGGEVEMQRIYEQMTNTGGTMSYDDDDSYSEDDWEHAHDMVPQKIPKPLSSSLLEDQERKSATSSPSTVQYEARSPLTLTGDSGILLQLANERKGGYESYSGDSDAESAPPPASSFMLNASSSLLIAVAAELELDNQPNHKEIQERKKKKRSDTYRTMPQAWDLEKWNNQRQFGKGYIGKLRQQQHQERVVDDEQEQLEISAIKELEHSAVKQAKELDMLDEREVKTPNSGHIVGATTNKKESPTTKDKKIKKGGPYYGTENDSSLFKDSPKSRSGVREASRHRLYELAKPRPRELTPPPADQSGGTAAPTKKVHGASARLMAPPKKKPLPPIHNSSLTISKDEQEVIVDRLYTKSIEHQQRQSAKALSQLESQLENKKLQPEEEEELIKKLHYMELKKDTHTKLEAKYHTPTPTKKMNMDEEAATIQRLYVERKNLYQQTYDKLFKKYVSAKDIPVVVMPKARVAGAIERLFKGEIAKD